MKLLILLIVVFSILLVGCASQMVEDEGDAEPTGESNVEETTEESVDDIGLEIEEEEFDLSEFEELLDELEGL